MAWFDDYNTLDDVTRPDVEKGTYQLKVKDPEISYWDDGRIRFDVSTEIVGGDYDGRFGPRKTYSFGGFSGTTKDGRDFEISADEQEETFVKQVMLMMDGNKPKVSERAITEKTLREIGKQLKSVKFYGRVVEDKEGYLSLKRIYPLSRPPKVLSGKPTSKAKFSADELAKV